MARKSDGSGTDDLTVEVTVEEAVPAVEAPIYSAQTLAEMEAGREALAAHAASLVAE